MKSQHVKVRGLKIGLLSGSLNGASRVLDIGGVNRRRQYSPDAGFEADWAELESDWKAIGKDFRSGISRVDFDLKR